MNDHSKISLLIPTYNAGELWPEVIKSINEQDFIFYKKIIVDSGSTDHTAALARQNGFEVITIPKTEFNHGATRQLLIDSAEDSSICVFLTQDAILATPQSVTKLVEAFSDPSTGLAYGRQLPHKNARPLEIHARLFNYPATSATRSFDDKDKMGFKVFFCSNSFSAYRVTALKGAGGFPSASIMGEDALTAAKLLINKHKIAYIAEATVYHSHSYTFAEEFKRYFDTRVFHEQNHWLIKNYGKPTGEGIRYVKSELAYVLSNNPVSLFKAITSVFAKWLGYSLGRYYKKLPNKLLKKLSMHSAFWV
jgi:rhamnosyltransferase